MSETIDADYVETGAGLAVREQSRGLATPMPTVTPAEAREAMEQYIAVCNAVLTPEDYQSFKQWDPKLKAKVEKKFKKKSAVKKLQTFWGISVAVRDVVRDDLGDGHFGFRCIAIATTPSGRTIESTGGCSTLEERFTPKRFDKQTDKEYETACRLAVARAYHDVMSTAETRATNRAVMNCIGVGGGEVTAEEVNKDKENQPPDERRKPTITVDSVLKKACALGIIPDTNDECRQELKKIALGAGVTWTVTAVDAWLETYIPPLVPTKPSDAQRSMAMALHTKLGHDDDTRHAYYELKYGVKSFNDLTRDQATELIDALQQNADAQTEEDL